ncbi:DUF3105 domain-containing protein [Actinomadura logoneensis]|uniref:DUF3105 domain-containing protein n=1 Tax=Actinomadura logoneensis TaxID=2293572 RepID=A0A372JGL2_9ACTN|nr:DUF3105 domain-containing protein [Actinomadura logoneensis]RFU39141.1 DUF3105 domain-containing protein [Actinomadura logoneensis]
MSNKARSRTPGNASGKARGSGRPAGGGSAPRKPAPRKNALTERQTPWGAIAFFTVIGLVAAVAIGFAFLQARSSGDGAKIAGLVSKEETNRDHVQTSVKYDTTPPIGGAHDPLWQNCGVYTAALRNENAVHALEHGAVWITYRPDLPTDQVVKLSAKVGATPYTLLSPYPGLDAPLVLSAWGKQLKVQSADDGRVDAFLKAFVRGPQTPEPGAACTGGKATP